MSLFDVDVRGLQQTILYEAPRILLEPLSNALDTAARDVIVRFQWRRGIATYAVEDNDPQGFAQLADAYTLFAPSQRKADPSARGRFGFGEKEFIALCYPGPVRIQTTTGTVTFDGTTRTVQQGARARRAAGSAITARLRLSRELATAFAARLRSLLVPEGVTVTLDLDGDVSVLAARPALRTFDAVLPTVLADEEGVLRATRRRTTVTVHAIAAGEEPMLYELGVPVVAQDGQWHINVQQKVPLARSRDAVTPAYLRTLHAAVLNATADLLTSASAKADWVTAGLVAAEPATLARVVHLVHGATAVIADPSCLEATKRAIDAGRPVLFGGHYDAPTWAAIREHAVLKPAGQYPELRGDMQTSADGTPPIPREAWSATWRAVADYAQALCQELLGRPIDVTIYRVRHGTPWAGACWANGDLSLNASRLPASWWTDPTAIDELLIHEFAHHRVSDHLSDAFHQECCRVGARLRSCTTRLAQRVAEPRRGCIGADG